MKSFVLGVAVTIVVCAAVVYIYFAAGIAQVATSASPMVFERTYARMAVHSRIEKETPAQVPVQADEADLTAAAHVYIQQCAVCHGVPGREQTAIAKGEFPRPPHLFKGKGVTDDEPGETYWKVTNGFRQTRMPGFSQEVSTTEMWQVSLLQAHADKLPGSTTAALAGPDKSGT
ncbi:MAG TPA: cytochrome c [Candidatus Acidoferrales bacterium]|jgi:mono/diheme cytochrome c family protein|nr:cytochrome c [Candidatus Acidoferrales bacterium]